MPILGSPLRWEQSERRRTLKVIADTWPLNARSVPVQLENREDLLWIAYLEKKIQAKDGILAEGEL